VKLGFLQKKSLCLTQFKKLLTLLEINFPDFEMNLFFEVD